MPADAVERIFKGRGELQEWVFDYKLSQKVSER